MADTRLGCSKIKTLQVHAPCPITAGQKTRMLEASFVRVCEAKRALGDNQHQGAGFNYINTRCLACQGKREHWPDELEIITAADVAAQQEETMTEKDGNTCEMCAKASFTKMEKNRGKRICSSCRHVVAAISTMPERVLSAAVHVGKRDEIAFLFGIESAWAETMAKGPSQEDLDRAEAWHIIARAMGMDINAEGITCMDIARQVAHQSALLEAAKRDQAEEMEWEAVGQFEFHQPELLSVADPMQEALVNFAIKVLRGEVTINHLATAE